MSYEIAWDVGTVLVSVGIAYGTVKGVLMNKVGFDKHTELCENAKAPIYDKIDANHTKTIDVLMGIKEDIGEIKGQLKRGL